MSWHKDAEPKWLECRVCKRATTEFEAEHERWGVHDVDGEREWECSTCEKAYISAVQAAGACPSGSLPDLKLALACFQFDIDKIQGRASADAWLRQWARMDAAARAYLAEGGDPRELVIAWTEHAPGGQEMPSSWKRRGPRPSLRVVRKESA